MDQKQTFKYDRVTDILNIDTVAPHRDQESEAIDDDVVARLNPVTGDIENLEVLFVSTRLLHADIFELPLEVELRRAA
jgi:hypothetical protein